MAGGRMTEKVKPEQARRIVREFLERLDSPRALTCWLLFEAGGELELVQLVTLECKVDDYDSIERFRPAYAATKFLSKCKSLRTGIDTRAVAFESAVKAESSCSSTNQVWRDLASGSVRTEWEPEIHRAIFLIAKILGPVPDISGNPEMDSFDPQSDPDWLQRLRVEVFDKSVKASRLLRQPGRSSQIYRAIQVGWSKGRTTSASGPRLSPYNKYRSRLDVTVSALRFASRELRDSPWWGAAALQTAAPVSVLHRAFTVTKGNVMLTVPKNAKTDRVICYEPHMNIWLQLKVGRHMRSQLSRAGIDLANQSVNQRRARLASKTGHLATIDLRSASDTVSLELVNQLLPIDWVCLLDDLRSKYTLWPDNVWRKNQKFSSMGNGFTFELESLLFYAICSAVSGNVSVYGDDIILPTENFDRAVAFLKFCGFEVNTSKSFSTGPFRESCGEDAYLGESCTPVYLRALPESTWDVVKLHNQVDAFARRCNEMEWRKWGTLLHRWRKRFPTHLGPRGFGDGHYHSNLDEACPPRVGNGWEGWWFLSNSPEFKKGVDSFKGYSVTSLAAGLCATLGPKAVRSLWGSTIDRRLVKYRTIRVLASFWPDALWV